MEDVRYGGHMYYCPVCSYHANRDPNHNPVPE